MEKEKRKKITIISLFTGLIILFIISLLYDTQIINAVQLIRTPLLDSFFSGILFLEKWFIFYPLIVISTTALLLWKKEKRKIIPFIIGSGIAILLAFLLKKVIARPRPITLTPDSFPSGHATFAFTPLPFLLKLSSGIGKTWIIIACLFAFTRFWFGMHYLSDIIAGAVLGYVIAWRAKKIFH